jgi:ribosomal protein S18 acetylase RimI-like enzyme
MDKIMTGASDSFQIPTALGLVRVITGGPQDAERYADQLTELYETDFVDPPFRESTFFSTEWFRETLLKEYVKASNFKIVTLWCDDKLTGFVYGCPLPSNTQWWKDVREPLSNEFIREDGHRTLALLDICVKRSLRGQKLASQLHARLLEGRDVERVTLLSSKGQQPAYSIFQHWGYRKIGTADPAQEGIAMDVFIRQLS